MPTNTKNLLTDAAGLPIPQAYDPVSDSYKPVQSKDGGMAIQFAGAAAVKHALVTVAGANQETSLPDMPCSEVCITALDTNTGVIYVGGTGVSATNYGAKLKADGFVTLSVQNASLVKFVASVAGEGVSILAT